jgi:hypothetical protein
VRSYRWDGYGVAGARIVQKATYCHCHPWKVVYFCMIEEGIP